MILPESACEVANQVLMDAVLGADLELCILRSERFGDAGAASDNGARDASGMPGVRTIIITATFQLCTVCSLYRYSSPSEKPRCRWLNEIECDR